MPNGLEPRLAFHFLNELLLRLVGRHPRDAFQRSTMLLLHSSTSRFLGRQLLITLRQLQISLLKLTIPLVYRADSFLEGLISLHHTLFCDDELGHFGLLLLLEFRFRLQHKVFRFELRFFDDIVSLPLGVLRDLTYLLLLLGPLCGAR